jgi:hypothetical protein
VNDASTQGQVTSTLYTRRSARCTPHDQNDMPSLATVPSLPTTTKALPRLKLTHASSSASDAVDKPPRFTRALAPCLFPRSARSWIDLPAATRTPYTQLSAAAPRISHLRPRFWKESKPSHSPAGDRPAVDRPAAGSTGAGRRAPPEDAASRSPGSGAEGGSLDERASTGDGARVQVDPGPPTTRVVWSNSAVTEAAADRARTKKTDRPRFLAGGQRSGLTREASVAISDDDGRPARRGRAERPRREPGRPRRS